MISDISKVSCTKSLTGHSAAITTTGAIMGSSGGQVNTVLYGKEYANHILI